MKELESEFYFGGDNLILIEVGNLKYKTLMNGWLNHLYLSANSSFNSKTLIISKKSGFVNKTNYEVTKEILPINKQEAKRNLEYLNKIAVSGRDNCWPIPPESGLAYALATIEQKNKMREVFQKKWEGDLYMSGERENLAMQLCFGRECKSSTFLEYEYFNDILMSLYKPILTNIK